MIKIGHLNIILQHFHLQNEVQFQNEVPDLPSSSVIEYKH